MKTTERRRMTELFAIQAETGRTKTIRKHVRAALTDAGCRTRQIDRQIYARKGTGKGPIPFIVAHADTVHRIVEPARYRVAVEADRGELVYFAYDPTTNAPRGIGGDDKCGLWVAIEAARRLENCGIIITVDEEIGGKGARRVPPMELASAAVLIQADRRGSDSAVYESSGVTISSTAWRSHVSPIIAAHGYEWDEWGTLTDVSEMSAEHIARVSCVNLSAGYYGAHTSAETVRESELENCLELTEALARASAGKRWQHTAGARYRYGYGDGFGYGPYVSRAPTRSVVKYGRPENPEPGALWHFGDHTFRLDEQGVWREIDDERQHAAYIVIPCDVAGCPNEAEDWHDSARLTLCADHLEDADQMTSAGYDPATITATLAHA